MDSCKCRCSVPAVVLTVFVFFCFEVTDLLSSKYRGHNRTVHKKYKAAYQVAEV